VGDLVGQDQRVALALGGCGSDFILAQQISTRALASERQPCATAPYGRPDGGILLRVSDRPKFERVCRLLMPPGLAASVQHRAVIPLNGHMGALKKAGV